MHFNLARGCKWRIVYTDDRLTNSPQYKQIFFKRSGLTRWMNDPKNAVYSIVAMSIMYEYPSLDKHDN